MFSGGLDCRPSCLAGEVECFNLIKLHPLLVVIHVGQPGQYPAYGLLCWVFGSDGQVFSA